jgi:hypothetical protein
MAKIKIKAVPKMQGGGYSNPPTTFMPYAPVTPAERESWNKYQAALSQVPGQYVRDWNRNQDVQRQVAQQTGFDYNRAAAIQADMMARSQSMPSSVSGITGKDPWGGIPSWVGTREKQKAYRTYQYEHLDPSGKRYPGTAGFMSTGTEPLTQQQMEEHWKTAYPTATTSTPTTVPATTTQTTPVLTGLAATGFPTREEAIGKYKERKASGQELPSNYFAGTRKQTGDPIGKIRSTGEETYKYGGMKKKIRIKSMPTNTLVDNIRMGAGEGETPMMWAGGYASKGPSHGYGNQQVGQGYALDRFWSSPTGYPGGTAKVSPYHTTGKTLPEAKEGGDINAEKQEQVLGDFDQDGSMELMNVNGKPHTQGGKDINVPSNSFVYSDTKALKIKDAKVLAMFGMKPKRGGYTPAEIAKKYDLNKFKKVLSDPNADQGSKTTAQLMTDNYLAKLDKLAQVQEGIKKHMGMDHHDPNAPKEAEYGGQLPEAQYGIRTGNIHGVRDWFVGDTQEQDNQQANMQVAQTVPPPYGMYKSAEEHKTGEPLSQEDVAFFTRAALHDPLKYAQLYGQGRVGAGLPGQGRADLWGPGYRNIKMGMEQDLAVDKQVQPLPTSGPNLMPASPGTITPSSVSTDLVTSTISKDKKGDRKKRNWNFGNFQVDPNVLGDIFNLMQMGQVKKFEPYEPVPQAVIPQVVFADPTRAIAAQQESARTAMEMAAQGNQRAARATALGIQGEAGKQAADVIAQYNAQNVAIANAANAQAAQITNELMAKQANRLAELNKANFLSDRDYQREMGRLQAEYVDRMQKHHDTAVKTAWLNKTSPYFDIDPYGFPRFKTGMESKYFADLQKQDPTLLARVKEYKKEFPDAKLGDLINLAKGISPKASDEATTSMYGGNVMRYGGSHMALPSMAPAYQHNAERLPHYQIGGEFIGLPSMPDVQLPAVDNTYYQQPLSSQYTQEEMSFSKKKPLSGVETKRMSKTDIATATNNPGNIQYIPLFSKLFGAVDSGIKKKDGGTFAAFPDLDTGIKAYQTQLFGDTDGIMPSRYYKADTPVDKALKKWSNEGYGSEIYPEIKNKTLGQLTKAERRELAKRQFKHESGDMYRLLEQRGVFKYGGKALQKFMK